TAGEVAGVREPVVWLAIGVQDPIEGHFLSVRHRTGDEGDRHRGAQSHGRNPFSVTRYATRSSSSVAVSLSRYDGMGESFTNEKLCRSDLASETRRSFESIS